MNVKTKLRAIALAVAGSVLFCVAASSRQTYTVKTPVWETTNAIEVIPDHDKKVPPCTLIRYLQGGRTNEFHAWACPVSVTTNQIAQPPIEVFVGPGTELRVTVPNIAKDDLVSVIAAFMLEDPAARKKIETVIGAASAVTFVLTTKLP